MRNVVLLLDAAADRHDDVGGSEVDRSTGFAERLLGLRPDLRCVDLRPQTPRPPACPLQLIGTIGARLNRDEVRSRATDADIGVQLALEKLADQHKSAAFGAYGYNVADQHAVESRGQLRSEVPDSVGMRQKNVGRLLGSNHLLQARSCIRQVCTAAATDARIEYTSPRRQSAAPLADHYGRNRQIHRRAQLLGRRSVSSESR